MVARSDHRAGPLARVPPVLKADRRGSTMLSTPANGPVLVPTGPFRRYATRYEPSRRDACLAWRELPPPVERGPDGIDGADEPESHQEFALLLDISHMGASVA